MSKILTTAATIIALGLAATVAADARGNFDRDSHPFAQAQTRTLTPATQLTSIWASEDMAASRTRTMACIPRTSADLALQRDDRAHFSDPPTAARRGAGRKLVRHAVVVR